MNSSTLSHIFASMWPLRSPSVRARYGSPVFFGLTCLETTTNVEVMTLFSCWVQSMMKNSFMLFGGGAQRALRRPKGALAITGHYRKIPSFFFFLRFFALESLLAVSTGL